MDRGRGVSIEITVKESVFNRLGIKMVVVQTECAPIIPAGYTVRPQTSTHCAVEFEGENLRDAVYGNDEVARSERVGTIK